MISLVDLAIRIDEFENIIAFLDRDAHYPLSLVCQKIAKRLPSSKKTTLKSITASIPLLKWARKNGCPWDNRILEAAASGGHLDVITWAYQNGCNFSDKTLLIAAELGHLNILEWAYKNNKMIQNISDIYTCASKNGHIHILEWAHNKGVVWDNALTCASVAYCGQLDVLKWLRSIGCPWSCITTMEAAKGGHLDVLIWAFENGCDMHDGVCAYAAQGGYLNVLKWARSKGLPWGNYTMWWAAIEDRLDILKWAHENGCICDHTRSENLRRYIYKNISESLISWVRDNLDD